MRNSLRNRYLQVPRNGHSVDYHVERYHIILLFSNDVLRVNRRVWRACK